MWKALGANRVPHWISHAQKLAIHLAWMEATFGHQINSPSWIRLILGEPPTGPIWFKASDRSTRVRRSRHFTKVITMSAWVAAYDISDDRSRERVARVLAKYGRRVQESVFVISLEPEDLGELRFSIGMHLANTDLFDLYPIDQRGTRSQWRWQRRIDDYDPVILLD
jgi:CRISPR-associated endonuclease Cas2